MDTAHSESQRSYHTAQHINECLELFDWSRVNGSEYANPWIEIALWYHDAIYQPKETENERKSADWAASFLTSNGVSNDSIQLVDSLIMATCHGEEPQEPQHQLLVDIDLSILGRDVERFQEYEQQIRVEYNFVPLFLYKRKRRALLKTFLQRPRLYLTDLFYEKFERQARINLVDSIKLLS